MDEFNETGGEAALRDKTPGKPVTFLSELFRFFPPVSSHLCHLFIFLFTVVLRISSFLNPGLAGPSVPGCNVDRFPRSSRYISGCWLLDPAGRFGFSSQSFPCLLIFWSQTIAVFPLNFGLAFLS